MSGERYISSNNFPTKTETARLGFLKDWQLCTKQLNYTGHKCGSIRAEDARNFFPWQNFGENWPSCTSVTGWVSRKVVKKTWRIQALRIIYIAASKRPIGIPGTHEADVNHHMAAKQSLEVKITQRWTVKISEERVRWWDKRGVMKMGSLMIKTAEAVVPSKPLKSNSSITHWSVKWGFSDETPLTIECLSFSRRTAVSCGRVEVLSSGCHFRVITSAILHLDVVHDNSFV